MAKKHDEDDQARELHYNKTLRELQIELVKYQRHLIAAGDRVLVIFEGRDAAGKDGAIKHIIEHLSPRETRVVALNKPSDRENAPMVLPALHPASTDRGRDRPLQPELVQPRRRRAGDGLLHRCAV